MIHMSTPTVKSSFRCISLLRRWCTFALQLRTPAAVASDSTASATAGRRVTEQYGLRQMNMSGFFADSHNAGILLNGEGNRLPRGLSELLKVYTELEDNFPPEIRQDSPPTITPIEL